MPPTIDDFDFPLDPSHIAQAPADRRDQSRLMVLDRATGRWEHRVFAELPERLTSGDLLVVNDTRVIPARFQTRRATGGRIEGLFLRVEADGAWRCLLKGAGRCRAGERLRLEGAPGVSLELLASRGEGEWSLRPDPPAPPETLLDSAGAMPLPPYIRREAGENRPTDRDRYQTVYAERPGAVAAPTAGLHFTPEVFRRLADRGVRTARLTLHVGLGTFLPVKADRIEEHEMHAEWYDLPAETAEAVTAARAGGGRVVAVGTTSVRVLETVAAEHGRIVPASGWTRAFLYPPAEFRAVDAMITNFHLPRSTLLMLVAAFCSPGDLAGVKIIRQAYAEAVRRQYRFYSYGDAMLIL